MLPGSGEGVPNPLGPSLPKERWARREVQEKLLPGFGDVPQLPSSFPQEWGQRVESES